MAEGVATPLADALKASTASVHQRKRVFSGIQPSGRLHIGNYLGAIRNWVADQDRYDNVFCIVDLHALTVPHEPAELQGLIRDAAALYIAAGIDPERSAVFVQSHIHEHAELTWILNCYTPTGWLNRMTQFKSKAGADQETASTGLYDYPVLMAADILLYHTHLVPVGEDQRQHIELTRDVAGRFNSLFGETFTLPEALIREVGARIMSLENPERKMSKSDPPGSYIALLDPPEVVRRKVARATTDSLRAIEFDPARPGIFNLLTIYQLFSGDTSESIERYFAGKGYREFKAELADVIIAVLEPLQRRYNELIRDPAYLDGVLRDGAARVRPIAAQTLADAMRRVGLR
jgi:tryptophanyl-tRNA synthetase